MPPPSPGRRNHPGALQISGLPQAPGRWNHLRSALNLGAPLSPGSGSLPAVSCHDHRGGSGGYMVPRARSSARSGMFPVLNCPERAASEGPGGVRQRRRLHRRPRLLLAGGIRGRRRVVTAEIAPNGRAYRALASGLAPSRSSGEAVVPPPLWARALIVACGRRRLTEAFRTGPYLWSGTARTL